MEQKKKIEEHVKNSMSGVFAFAFLFLVSSICVSLFFPEEQNNKNDFNDALGLEPKVMVSELPQDFFVEDEKSNIEIKEGNSDAVAKAMQCAVVDFSKKEDKGLKFYRNPEFKDSVIWFYNQITGNEIITEAILTNAEKNDIPLSLAFALAYSESSYNVNAVNKNTNSSIDRGLFQLNNKSFPELVEKDFFDPFISAKYGLGHLRFCLDYAGNEVAALAMYNAGTNRVRKGETPQVTLNYVSKIMNYKNGVDDLFDFQSENWLDSTLFETIAFLR